MKLKEVDRLVGALCPELAEWEVVLAPKEVEVLRLAMTICEKAHELELKHMSEDEGCESDYAWAEIYLRDILREGGIKWQPKNRGR